MKVKNYFSTSLLATMFAIMFTGSTMAQSSTTVVVTPTDMMGWVFASENAAGGSGSLVSGPGTPPLGLGSARLEVPTSANGYILAREGYRGTRLDQITSLSYSTYRTSSGDPAQAPSFFITFDNDVTDADTTFRGRLTYEPYHTETVLTGVWQTWNPFAATGNWWFSNTTMAATSGCAQATPCSLTQVLAAFPNAGFRDTAGQPMGFKVGSGWHGFNGNVDALTIGVSGNDITYDFEPYAVATNKDQCKNNGWRNVFRLDGTAFRNQGDCIQYVNNGH